MKINEYLIRYREFEVNGLKMLAKKKIKLVSTVDTTGIRG